MFLGKFLLKHWTFPALCDVIRYSDTRFVTSPTARSKCPVLARGCKHRAKLVDCLSVWPFHKALTGPGCNPVVAPGHLGLMTGRCDGKWMDCISPPTWCLWCWGLFFLAVNSLDATILEDGCQFRGTEKDNPNSQPDSEANCKCCCKTPLLLCGFLPLQHANLQHHRSCFELLMVTDAY